MLTIALITFLNENLDDRLATPAVRPDDRRRITWIGAGCYDPAQPTTAPAGALGNISARLCPLEGFSCAYSIR